MKVGLAIYNILTDNGEVDAIVSGRVFPNVAPQTTTFPFIIYDVEGEDPNDTKEGASTLDVDNITVSCYSKTYSEASDLALKIRTALDRQSGTFGGVNIQSIQYDGYNDIFDDNHEDGVYRKAIDFNVRIINS
jgi:hypothetical protein